MENAWLFNHSSSPVSGASSSSYLVFPSVFHPDTTHRPVARLNAKNPGYREIPVVILPSRPTWQVSFPSLGRVCTEFPSAVHHRVNSLSVYSQLPASPVSLVRGTIWHPNCEPLVSEGMGLSTHPPPACYMETQEPGQCTKICYSHLPSGTKGLALHQGYPFSSISVVSVSCRCQEPSMEVGVGGTVTDSTPSATPDTSAPPTRSNSSEF